MRRLKFNWGTGIAIFIAAFLITVAILIWLASRIDYDLVTKEYYPQGLKYQNDINRIENLKRIGQTPDIAISSDSLRFMLPEFFRSKFIEGSIELYRPSDARLDIRDSLGNDGQWAYATNQLTAGKYEINASWRCDGVDYLFRDNLHIEPR